MVATAWRSGSFSSTLASRALAIRGRNSRDQSDVMLPAPLRIEPIAGYTPTIGRLVGMLTYSRSTTLAAVEDLTLAELDHLHDATSNSIGALLAHIATVERSYQILTFEERLLSPRENELWAAALKLGARGRDLL